MKILIGNNLPFIIKLEKRLAINLASLFKFKPFKTYIEI